MNIDGQIKVRRITIAGLAFKLEFQFPIPNPSTSLKNFNAVEFAKDKLKVIYRTKKIKDSAINVTQFTNSVLIVLVDPAKIGGNPRNKIFAG